MKVFISQPMKGKTNDEIIKERKRVEKNIKEEYPNEEIEFIDSFFKDAPHDAKPLYFLGKALELLSTADIAVFTKGWEKARGCLMEYEACENYGIKFMIEL